MSVTLIAHTSQAAKNYTGILKFFDIQVVKWRKLTNSVERFMNKNNYKTSSVNIW